MTEVNQQYEHWALRFDTLITCEGCLVVGCDHGPQAEVAQGVGPGPLVER